MLCSFKLLCTIGTLIGRFVAMTVAVSLFCVPRPLAFQIVTELHLCPFPFLALSMFNCNYSCFSVPVWSHEAATVVVEFNECEELNSMDKQCRTYRLLRSVFPTLFSRLFQVRILLLLFRWGVFLFRLPYLYSFHGISNMAPASTSYSCK